MDDFFITNRKYNHIKTLDRHNFRTEFQKNQHYWFFQKDDFFTKELILLKVKKIPQRKCVACQDRDSKKTLVRIVKTKEGQIFLDLTGKANGRGAYICNDSECLEKAIKSNALGRAFKQEIPQEVYAKLREEIKNNEE